jgi:Uma2 family endonuclease
LRAGESDQPFERRCAARAYLDGLADLVVEVVSVPESVERDRKVKFGEYQAGGVPEHWILDSESQQADFYQLDEQGAYQAAAPDVRGNYRSRALPGLWLDLAWLWQDPLPDAEDAAAAIIGKPYADYRRARLRQLGL